jgi:hypothetical protein
MKTILIWIWGKNRLLGCRLDLSGSKKNPVAGSCEHKLQSLSSIQDREFLAQASDYQFLVNIWPRWIGHISHKNLSILIGVSNKCRLKACVPREAAELYQYQRPDTGNIVLSPFT